MKLGIGSYAFAWAIGVPGYSPRKPMSAMDLLNITDELGGGSGAVLRQSASRFLS